VPVKIRFLNNVTCNKLVTIFYHKVFLSLLTITAAASRSPPPPIPSDAALNRGVQALKRCEVAREVLMSEDLSTAFLAG